MDGVTIVALISLFISISTFIICWLRDINTHTIVAYQNLQKYLTYLYEEYSKDEIETFVTDKDSEEYKIISSCIAQIEIFARGIRDHLYSFRTFYSIAHGFLDGSLRDRIMHIIDIKNDSLYGKGYYQNTTWLIDKMDKRTEKLIKKLPEE